MSRFLVNNPSYIPADTEIRFISFGSEEAGLRGSRRYVQRHLDELKRLDARLLNFETVAHPEITILTSDLNGTVENSPEMVTSVVAAAERAGVPYKVSLASEPGATRAHGLASRPPHCLASRQMVASITKSGYFILTIEPLNVLKLTEWYARGEGEN
jgi:hypothetical protein